MRRDIDRLRELEYPITTVKGPAGGYRLEAGTRMPPLLFDDAQAVALAVALQTAATGTAAAEDASRALATLRQVMPPRLRHRVDLVCITAVEPLAVRDAVQFDTRVLVDLSRAIQAHEELGFDYVRGSGPPDDDARRVQPHHLVAWAHRWYLVAWDLRREDWRTLRVERIRLRTPTGPRFVPRELPGGDVSTFIIGRFCGIDGTTSAWPCQGEVILHLPAVDVAPFAQDGIVEELGPRCCRLALGSWSWTGLAAAIGRFDSAIDIIGPPRLATAFADLAARYVDAARTAGSGVEVSVRGLAAGGPVGER